MKKSLNVNSSRTSESQPLEIACNSLSGQSGTPFLAFYAAQQRKDWIGSNGVRQLGCLSLAKGG